MIPVLIITFLVALLDWVAVAKGLRKVEIFAKPATLLILLGWLLSTGLHKFPLACFSVGIFFSLLGDIFLLFPSAVLGGRWFIFGMAAFLLAHVAYIVGLNTPLPDVSPLWSFVIAIVLALTASRILRRLLAALMQKGLSNLVRPVGVYAVVITLMLLSAILTVYNPLWRTAPAALIALGAIAFYFSDLLLSWNMFVQPVKNGRLFNMILYHLGQIGLVVGVILQFAKP